MAELLAKPDVPLILHLREVAARAEWIATRLRLPHELILRSYMAGLLHDVGKATESFQSYLLETSQETEDPEVKGNEPVVVGSSPRRFSGPRPYPHPLASFPIAFALERAVFARPFFIAGAVLSHHSGLTPKLYNTFTSAPDWAKNVETLIREILEDLSKKGLGPFPSGTSIVKLAKQPPLLNHTLELDGSKGRVRGFLQKTPPLQFALVKASLHLADWSASAKIEHPRIFFLADGRDKVQSHIENRISRRGLHLHWYQVQLSTPGSDFRYLRAPTGSGKTEGFLLWGANAQRILYLLPTQATANAMWTRLSQIFGATNVGLAHGRAIQFMENETGVRPDNFLFSSVFAKPVTVATLDQFLLGYLHGKHWEERLAFGTSSAVIFDEIHAYEPYTLGLLRGAIDLFPPRRYIMGSATLPSALARIFGPGDLIEAEEKLFSQRRHAVSLTTDPVEKLIPVAADYARRGKTVLVIANTVAKAQQLYLLIRDTFSMIETTLLHSRFTPRDRTRKEERAKNTRAGSVLISTQIVEVSLDISYDVLITQLAPVDALVQRMGRVNRYGRDVPAPVKVSIHVDPGSSKIYGEDVIQKSLELLGDIPEVPSDRDLVEVCTELYDFVTQRGTFLREFQDGQRTVQEINDVLGCYTIDLSDESLRKKFLTRRRGGVNVDVLPQKYLSKALRLIESGRRSEIWQLLVPIPLYWLFQFGQMHFWWNEQLGLYVTNLRYTTEFGLASPVENGEVMESPIV